MKKARWIILILLVPLLVAGALLAMPGVRFAFLLRAAQFRMAEEVYLSHMRDSNELEAKAEKALKGYVDGKLDQYYDRELTFDQIMTVLRPLSETKLPQDDVVYCITAASEMEAARNALAEADAAFHSFDYARAIPLFHRGLIADETAAERLYAAEDLYRNQVLDRARAAMDAGELTDAETAILEGQAVLGDGDVDLAAALADLRRMQADVAYGEAIAKARQLLHETGPETAIRFMEDLRAERSDAFEIEYLEQQLLHEYEEDICARAMALWAGGDATAACAMLEEGLRWIDSAKAMMLLCEIRGTILFILGDMPVLRDETASPRTGAESTLAWDQVLADARGNQYSHSLSADAGSVTFDLAGEYALFAGTVACPQGQKSDIYRSSATLQIYGDGVLLTEFRDVKRSTLPTAFSLSVAGVKELTLFWTCEGANGWKDWGRFATLFDGRFMTSAPQSGQS